MIDRSLNLVLTVQLADGGEAHVHSVPITRQVYERYFLIMARAFARIFNEGLGHVSGPRVAYLMLRDVAGEERWPDVERGLIAEIERLTNVAVLGPEGWQLQPFASLVAHGTLSQEDRLEVLNELVFFTLLVRIGKPAQARGMMALVGTLWGSRTTSSPATEWTRSLPISTPDASSGETAATSSQTASTISVRGAGSTSPSA